MRVCCFVFTNTHSVHALLTKGVVYCFTSNTQNPFVCPFLSFTMLGHSGTGMQAIFCNMFGKIGQRTSLNLSPLFDHAVIVQKSPGRFLYVVGRGHSHQEADQVISIISLIPHSGTDLIKPRHVCCFSKALSFENQQNCWSDT